MEARVCKGDVFGSVSEQWDFKSGNKVHHLFVISVIGISMYLIKLMSCMFTWLDDTAVLVNKKQNKGKIVLCIGE